MTPEKEPQPPIVVQEALKGQISGLNCKVNVIMHMGLIKEEAKQVRCFGDPHRFLKGRLGGTLRFLSLDSEVLYILDGCVDLCWQDERTPYTQYMHYHMLLASATGAKYLMTGKKEMKPFLGGITAWTESTTLLVKFQQIAPAHTDRHTRSLKLNDSCNHQNMLQKSSSSYPVLEGVLTVSMFELLKSTITLQGPKRFTFIRLLLESILRTYMLKNPRDIKGSMINNRVKREVIGLDSSSDHVLHFIATDDGVTISARQWVKADRGAESSSSNVVLLLNGHSTENFWLPTEPTDIVRTLLQNGYEPWLLNTRLSPLHIPDQPFNLDDLAMYDVPAAFKKIEEVRGDNLAIHVLAHCVGGLHIHMAVLGGYISGSRVASLLCTNSSMFFSVTNLAMCKLIPPLMPISMAILGKNTSFSTRPTAAGGTRHQLLRFIARQIPRVELCDSSECKTFSGVFGNAFWHANVSKSTHEHYAAPSVFPMCAMPHLRRIILRGHLVDAGGRDIYMTHPERMAFPTTHINGGKEILVIPRTGKLAFEFMRRHHPQFVHLHHIIPEYGHSDLVIGENSHLDVFPRILDHLGRVREGRHQSGMKTLSSWEEAESNGNALKDARFLFHLLPFVGIQVLLVYLLYIILRYRDR